MTEVSSSEKNIPGRKMMKWGWFLLLAPIVGLIIIFCGWTLLSLITNILSSGVTEGSSETDPVGIIMAFLKSGFTLGGLLCTIWAFSLSPVGLILLIVGYIKKGRKETVV